MTGAVHYADRSTRRRNRVHSAGPFIVGAILILILIAASTFVSIGGVNVADAAVQRGATLVEAAVQSGKSLIEMIQKRSPGKRIAAILTKTKHKAAARHERALPKVRMAGPVLPPLVIPPALVDVVAPPLPMTASLGPLDIAPFGSKGGFPILAFSPPGGGGIFVPPGENPPVPPPPPPPPPPSAVPEPESWAMMLIGFAVIGWQVRRHYRPQKATGA